MERHAAECEACRAELGQARGLIASLKGFAPDDPGELFWKRFNSEIHRRIDLPATVSGRAARRRPSVGFARRAAALAVAAVLVISVATVMFFNSKRAPVLPIKKPVVALNVTQTAGNAKNSVSQEEEIALAALGTGSVEIPHFKSLDKTATVEKKAVANVGNKEKPDEDQAVEVIDSGTYDQASAGQYKIPDLVNGMTEEEARNVLEALPASKADKDQS
jgi:hypothetical protein